MTTWVAATATPCTYALAGTVPVGVGDIGGHEGTDLDGRSDIPWACPGSTGPRMPRFSPFRPVALVADTETVPEDEPRFQ